MELWDKGYSIYEISELLHFDRNTLSNHLTNLGVSKKDKYKRGAQQANKTRTKPVYQYDIDGNYINEYSSLKEVQKQFNGIRISTNGKYIQSFNSVKEASALFGDTKLSKIPRVCRKEISQAYGFLWRYFKVEHL